MSDNVDQVLKELKTMQEELDDVENVEVTLETLRIAVGHLTFCLIVLIEENNKISKKLNKVFGEHIEHKDNANSLYS